MDTHTHTTRSRRDLPALGRATTAIALFAATTFLPAVASGQLRVDTTIYASSGSCANCDLSGKRMNGMTLKNANFAGSVFNRSNLSGGRLDGSDLSGAHFRKAMLYGVRGTNVTMRSAVFEDATLTGARLTHSSLRGANFRRAELERGQFHDNDFKGAVLSGAKLSGADLTRSDFAGARLDNAELRGAVLDDSTVTGVRFAMADLDGASLSGTDLSGSDLALVSGLTQGQLDAACGDGQTRLPAGLSLSLCDGAAADDDAAPETVRSTSVALDRALGEVEAMLSATRDPSSRTRLERIHRDLTQHRNAHTR